MPTQLDPVYDPKRFETAAYQLWDKAGSFHAEPSGGETYSIVIPPPNVTAPLHLGHALNNTLQDILIRWQRMMGKATLWMPGTDHAGIATQTVVEKRILAQEGRRRTDFDREEFVGRVQAWKDEYEARILAQLKAMGCSCDWDRTRFTMDDMCARAVRAAFFQLFADGLIYRGKRLVNWDPATQTVLADDEVEHETIKGFFWYLRYPLVDSVEIEGKRIEWVTVATTRPETMLGDTAVAINPRDPRAKALKGKQVRLPIVGRIIPIVEDEYVVLPDPNSDDAKARFATGFLKVTPAHDPNDWEIGRRHDLPVVNVMAPDGSISDKHGWTDASEPEAQNLLGMDRFEAREAIVEYFRSEGLLEEVRDYEHEVGHSYRSHVPIEPYLSDQWYVAVKRPIANCKLQIADWVNQHAGLVEKQGEETLLKGTDVPVNSLAGMALMPLLDGRLKFVPERYANNYRSWLENLRDWPISRQLWWGHQIPVWYVTLENDPFDDSDKVQPSEKLDHLKLQFERRLDKLAAARGLKTGTFFCRGIEGNFAQAYVCSRTTDGDALLRALETVVGDLEAHEVEPGGKTPLARFRPDGFSQEATEAIYRLSHMVSRLGQDSDVLDTWFSSGLWPISTMGWPQESELLKSFYPTSVLCTAREIITLWVSRMVMFGQYFAGDIPFADVYIHAMIQDGEGRKMSKSLGNGIDPLEVIDSHGADALRYTLAAMTTETQDVRMPVEHVKLPDGREMNTSPKFDIGRNFCNKLWNASRFAMMNLEALPAFSQIDPRASLADRWILSRLHSTVRDTTAALEAYRFNDVASTIYRFMWDDFCDWYLEIAKGRINAGDSAPKAIIAYVLDGLLRLLHPIAPFVTETIWQHLNEVAPARGPQGAAAEKLLITAAWPTVNAEWIDAAVETQFALLQELIRGIRQVRTTHNVPPSRELSVLVRATGESAALVEANAALIRSQARLSDLAVHPDAARPDTKAATVVAAGVSAFVADVVDVPAERARLSKERQTVAKGIAGSEGKLNNEKFLAKAPPDVVAAEKQRLAEMQARLEHIDKALADL